MAPKWKIIDVLFLSPGLWGWPTALRVFPPYLNCKWQWRRQREEREWWGQEGQKDQGEPRGKQNLREPSPGKVLEATESFPESQRIMLMLQKIFLCWLLYSVQYQMVGWFWHLAKGVGQGPGRTWDSRPEGCWERCWVKWVLTAKAN